MRGGGSLDWLIIGKVYEQMDTMLGQIKDIVHLRDVNLYSHIHMEVENGGKS
jgi:hypothetical protein